MLADVKRARKSISFARYVYEKSEVSAEIAHALAERCRAGAAVYLLLDFAGSHGFPTATAKRFRSRAVILLDSIR